MIFVALNVADLERSVAFYRDGFGIEFHRDSNQPETDVWYGGHHAAYSWVDGAFLHFALFPARVPERPVSRDVQIGFTATDIDLAHARAVGAGARVVHAPRAEAGGVPRGIGRPLHCHAPTP